MENNNITIWHIVCVTNKWKSVYENCDESVQDEKRRLEDTAEDILPDVTDEERAKIDLPPHDR